MTAQHGTAEEIYIPLSLIFRRVVSQLTKNINMRLRKQDVFEGLNFLQIRILDYLSKNAGSKDSPIISNGIVETLNVDRGLLSRNLNLLEEKGLLNPFKPSHETKDRRTREISLTEEGKRVAQCASQALQENFKDHQTQNTPYFQAYEALRDTDGFVDSNIIETFGRTSKILKAREDKIGGTQSYILASLREEKTLTDISITLGFDQGLTSKQLAIMKNSGLVSETPHHEDYRYKIFSLTELGREKSITAREAIQSLHDDSINIPFLQARHKIRNSL